MAKSINFDTGIKEFVINGDESNVIRINCSDPNLIGRMEQAEKKFGEIIDKYQSEELTANILDFDAELKATIDEAFNADISAHAFGKANCLSYVGNGEKMLFEAFLEAFIPLIKDEIAKSSQAYAEAHAKKVESYIEEAIASEDESKAVDDDYAEFLKWKESKKADVE